MKKSQNSKYWEKQKMCLFLHIWEKKYFFLHICQTFLSFYKSSIVVFLIFQEDKKLFPKNWKRKTFQKILAINWSKSNILNRCVRNDYWLLQSSTSILLKNIPFCYSLWIWTILSFYLAESWINLVLFNGQGRW